MNEMNLNILNKGEMVLASSASKREVLVNNPVRPVGSHLLEHRTSDNFNEEAGSSHFKI